MEPGSAQAGAGFSAVILAAGTSTRMRGGHKMMLDVGGEPAIRRTVRAVLGAKPLETVVVVGYRSADVIAALAGLPVRCVANPRFEEGQPTSVAAGIAALRQTGEAVMICLGDLVLLKSEDYAGLAQAFLARQPRTILVPFFGGQRGNPVVFPQRYAEEVLAGRHPAGLRKRMDQHPEEMHRHSVAHDAFVTDMDTPEDYRRVLERLQPAQGFVGSC